MPFLNESEVSRKDRQARKGRHTGARRGRAAIRARVPPFISNLMEQLSAPGLAVRASRGLAPDRVSGSFSGHLFERRYDAKLIDADEYLLLLLQYIHQKSCGYQDGIEQLEARGWRLVTLFTAGC